jgi:hypothetical protein
MERRRYRPYRARRLRRVDDHGLGYALRIRVAGLIFSINFTIYYEPRRILRYLFLSDSLSTFDP